jgi:anti-sigma factor RsiW
MPDHLSERQIALYCERRIPPEELLQVDDHVSQCPDCRARLASSIDRRAASPGVTSPRQAGSREDGAFPRAPVGSGHVTYEHLEAFVDGQASDAEKETLRAHVDACRICASELHDMSDFKAALSAAGKKDPKRKEGWWANFTALQLTPSRVALALAMSAAIVLVAALERKRLASPPSIPPVNATKANPTGPTDSEAQTLSAGSSLFALAINELPPDEQRGVLESLSQRIIKPPDILAELQGHPETLLGESPQGARFAVLEPLAEVVSDDRPVFRWQPLAGATSYSVAIFDSTLDPVQSSPPLRGTQWKPTRPMKRGQVYQWQVTAAMMDGRSITSPRPPSPGAKFRVLDQAKAKEFEQFRKAHPEAHLVLGVIYAQAGLFEDAESELRRIPHGGAEYELAQQLLRSLREKR